MRVVEERKRREEERERREGAERGRERGRGRERSGSASAALSPAQYFERRDKKKREGRGEGRRPSSALSLSSADAPPFGGSFSSLSEAERSSLLRNLKERWQRVNAEYQKFTLSLERLDTVGKMRKKADCEREMREIESSIALLSHKNVLVDRSK